MPPRLILGVILTALLHGQTTGADDASTRSIERTLTAVVQWEILWNDSPKGFRLPADGLIALAVHAASDSVSYCSHQAGVCVTYRTGDDRNWEGSGQTPCDDNGSDLDALLTFIGRDPITRDIPPGGGVRGFSGFPAAGSGITWTTMIALGTRAEIVMKYRQLHPPEMADLQNWLRSKLTGDQELKSITVACFTPTDPMVYYYADRPTEGPVGRPTAAPTIVSVFWRLDRPEEWVVAGYSQQWQNPERFDEMRRTIESVACSTLNFK